MAYIDEARKLEQNGKVRLIEVDGDEFGGGLHRYHYHAIPHTTAEIEAAAGDEEKLKPKSIFFGGLEYGFWPYGIEGLAMSTEQAAQPNMTLANQGGVITAICLATRNMLKAKVTIIETYANFLDGAADADPSEKRVQTFWIDTKTYEDDEIVTFELSSPGDLDGVMLPKRQVTMLCHWALSGQYRSGDGCSYNGKAYFDADGNPVQDPALDVCGGCMADCIKRFGAGLTDPKAAVLDFGGFPASNLINAN